MEKIAFGHGLKMMQYSVNECVSTFTRLCAPNSFSPEIHLAVSNHADFQLPNNW